MAKLPVFIDLAGKRALLAGDTNAVAWKAELLAAAGADVSVFAPTPCAELSALAKKAPLTGRVVLIDREPVAADFEGITLAVADLPNPDDARAFADQAHRAGALVNVIDNPEFCDIQFGAIVNRSPVMIGISTDGAAPILGQAIRRRLEAALPPGLAGWAAAARDMRTRVAQALTTAPSRRRFWERFADLAFTRAPGMHAEATLENLLTAEAREPTPKGRVSLVGAGPGDAEYLTLKAVRALQSADVVLYDDLVEPGVLELARREAKRIHVGKRGHRPSCKQGDINDLLVDLARQGNRVVRLKSGDPMIFGRAGEEVARLAAAGIEVDVVPGISAGLAFASTLGVSLTHRDMAHSVRFITGHGRDGGLPADLDWRGLADPETTLIIYMGGRTSGALASRLIAEGLPANTPVRVAINVAKPGETHWAGPLDHLEDAARDQHLAGPVIIGIGRVFAEAVRPTALVETSAFDFDRHQHRTSNRAEHRQSVRIPSRGSRYPSRVPTLTG